MKQDLANLDRTDTFKNFVDNEEFENFIESFKTLPGYKTYGKALKDYKDVSQPAQEQTVTRLLHCTDPAQLLTARNSISLGLYAT